MNEESQVVFHQRWVKTAEADVHSARHKRLIWAAALILTSAAYFTSQFAPGLDAAKSVHLFTFIPFLISLVGVGLSLSKLHDAEKFLTECRQGLAKEIQSNR